MGLSSEGWQDQESQDQPRFITLLALALPLIRVYHLIKVVSPIA